MLVAHADFLQPAYRVMSSWPMMTWQQQPYPTSMRCGVTADTTMPCEWWLHSAARSKCTCSSTDCGSHRAYHFQGLCTNCCAATAGCRSCLCEVVSLFKQLCLRQDSLGRAHMTDRHVLPPVNDMPPRFLLPPLPSMPPCDCTPCQVLGSLAGAVVGTLSLLTVLYCLLFLQVRLGSDQDEAGEVCRGPGAL